MKTNIQVASNIMIDDAEHRDHSRFIPGDLFAQIYPEKLNPAYLHHFMTSRQIMEYKQYLRCQLCHRTCAGSCGLRPRGA